MPVPVPVRTAMPVPIPNGKPTTLPLPLSSGVPLYAPKPVPTRVILGMTVPKNDPWLAATASLLVTGGGQAYNDQWWKSGLFFASNLLYFGGYVGDFFTGQQVFRWTALGVMAAVKGWSVWDAVATSQAERQKLAQSSDGMAQPTVAWQWQF